MIPIKDIIPPRTPPVVAIGILVLASLLLVMQRWLEFETEQSVFSVVVNMLWLWIFADNVEDRMGHWCFGGCYLLCHAAGAMARALLDPMTRMPIGLTSGAVAGVMGAYLVLYPRSRVLMFVPIPLMLLEVPAGFFLGGFVVLNAPGGPIALVEVGTGLFAGALLCLMLRRPVVW